jgi:hypothetical protein
MRSTAARIAGFREPLPFADTGRDGGAQTLVGRRPQAAARAALCSY